MNIRVMPLAADRMKPKPDVDAPLAFGRQFTDRMLLAEWRDGRVALFRPESDQEL